MTVATLGVEARRNVALFSSVDFQAQGVRKFKKKQSDDSGEVLILVDVPVFRSGTFRDSMGFQHTWDPMHISQMVSHHNLLTSRKIVESVPVRKGHGSFLGDPMDGLIGWHTSLRAEDRTNPADGKEYSYLLADFEILDKEAIEKINSGLWRNLSSEIMSYVTNDETEFWPFYGGVAYVDFSAVEGLREFSKNSKSFSVMFENPEEARAMTGTQDNPQSQGQQGQAQGSQQAPVAQADPTAPQAGGTEPVQPQGETQAVAPQPVSEPTADQGAQSSEDADHSQGGTAFAFKLNGQAGQPFKIDGMSGTQLAALHAAQAHIDVLEGFRKDTKEQSRKDFVAGLANSGKILASAIPQMETAALGMDDASFAAWSAAYASAPASPLFDQGHGQQSAQQGPDAQHQKERDMDRMSILRGIITEHKRGGKTEEFIKETKSYKELVELEKKYPQQTD